MESEGPCRCRCPNAKGYTWLWCVSCSEAVGQSRRGHGFVRPVDDLAFDAALVYVDEYNSLLPESLTTRQQEILAVLCTGISQTSELAAVLKLEPRTIENHLNIVFSKTGIETSGPKRAELVSAVLLHWISTI